MPIDIQSLENKLVMDFLVTSGTLLNTKVDDRIFGIGKVDQDPKELTYFMHKSCFTPVLVLMDFNLMFMHFSSLWGANDLFSKKIMNQPIRAGLATIG